MTGRRREVVLVHGLADGQAVWSSERHARGHVAHTRVLSVGEPLALVTWDGSLDCQALDARVAATLHLVQES